MARLRNSVLANYAGQAWVGLMGIVFVPAYLRELGAERFGLVAFMLSLQAISLLLDMGAGVFLGRELAQRNHDPQRRGSIRQLVRSFEWLMWPMALTIFVALYAGSTAIASDWLEPTQLGPAQTTSAIQLMGLVVALLWPTSFYAASLSGLEQQPRLNVLVAVFATLRFAGVLPVLYWTDTGLAGFLWWHAIVAAAQTLCSAALLWRLLPPAAGPVRMNWHELLDARRFAFGVFGVTALGLLLGQMDRFTLSALRPLAEFGQYAVAITISAGLGRLVQPMFNAIYPRLSRFAAEGDQAGISDLYHLASQIVAVVVAAIAAIICVHAQSVLLLWTGDAALAAVAALPLSLLFAGAAMNGLLNIPFALQLAHGWTGLAATGNLIAVVVGAPLYVVAINRFGMVGAAGVSLAINFAWLALGLPLMHRRLLRGELTGWYLRSVMPPLLAAMAVSLLARLLWPAVERNWAGASWLAAVAMLSLLAAAIATPGPRALLHRHVWQRITRR
ncbi:lipopolysaccharide biosynthesis protein [Montanilutibacter psychrotolerans]|uniref:Polysaccharide biosynthesis protein n=1 Tax=Montanilutibacter psychrotolerans TaxID=1327343 RepID=A0A3M8SSG3_9GAMM|nr:oligosaccharide flippase family protein [Lysobacter psychrotolerans]RNF84268.1 hypothetical protein EER27_07720 [Lysobacter psychrotolerans]